MFHSYSARYWIFSALFVSCLLVTLFALIIAIMGLVSPDLIKSPLLDPIFDFFKDLTDSNLSKLISAPVAFALFYGACTSWVIVTSILRRRSIVKSNYPKFKTCCDEIGEFFHTSIYIDGFFIWYTRNAKSTFDLSKIKNKYFNDQQIEDLLQNIYEYYDIPNASRNNIAKIVELDNVSDSYIHPCDLAILYLAYDYLSDRRFYCDVYYHKDGSKIWYDENLGFFH